MVSWLIPARAVHITVSPSWQIQKKEKKVEEIMIVGDVGSQIKPLNTIQKAKSSWIILEKFAYLAEDIPEVG